MILIKKNEFEWIIQGLGGSFPTVYHNTAQIELGMMVHKLIALRMLRQDYCMSEDIMCFIVRLVRTT